MRIGSLFSGAGMLDVAALQLFPAASVAWHCETDPGASRVLAHHWPDVPNLGDVTAIDWSAVEPVDVITAGYPCQPFSAAGRRQGVLDVRHLWPSVAEAMSVLRPRMCLFENVAGHLSLGFDEVLRDLQILGYDTDWCLARAADVGACHKRARVFILAKDGNGQLRSGVDRRRGVYRPSRDEPGRPLHAQSRDLDDRQGPARAESDGGDVRRQGSEQPGRDVSQARSVQVAPVGTCCGDCDPRCTTGLAGESACCGHRPRVLVDGRERAATEERQCAVVCGYAPLGPDVCCPDQGSESTGARSGTAFDEPDSGVRGRLMVGARRQPVRPCAVHGPLPGVGLDAIRQGVRTGLFATGVDALLPAPSVADGTGEHVSRSGDRQGEMLLGGLARAAVTGELLPTPRASDGAKGGPNQRGSSGDLMLPSAVVQWGDYERAIRRQEAWSRPAPEPTQPNRQGQLRLAPAFSEWMMAWPAGWVTDPVLELSRTAQLRVIGNGVVPPQAVAAFQYLLAASGVAA